MAATLRKRALPRFDHSSSQSTRIFSNFGTLSSWIFCSSWANFGRDRRWWCGFRVGSVKVKIEWFCCFRNTPRGRDSCGAHRGPRGGVFYFFLKTCVYRRIRNFVMVRHQEERTRGKRAKSGPNSCWFRKVMMKTSIPFKEQKSAYYVVFRALNLWGICIKSCVR